MKKLTPATLKFIGSKFGKFCNVLYDNCDTYIFYRGYIYSNSKGFICIDFLANDVDGIFKCPNLCYDPEKGILYLSRKFKLLNERAVADALHSLIEDLTTIGIPVSNVYFDADLKGNYIGCYLEEDVDEVGSFILYLINRSDCSDYQDAVRLCGEVLCCDWRKMLARKEGATT